MQLFRKHIARVIVLIVALQLLNLSIYAQDFKPLYADQNNSEVNISETIVEFVVESVLGYKDAIPEQSQHHKDLHFHKHVSFKAISIERNDLLSASQIRNATLPVWLYEDVNDLYLQDFDPKPPKIG